MRWNVLDTTDDRRTLILIFEQGDEVTDGLLTFAREQRLDGSHFTGIGALQDVVLGYWDWDKKDYDRIAVREQVEVLSLVGNIAQAPDGGPKVHAHVVVGKRDGSAHGGHLLEAHVRPTLEVIITELPTHLQRRLDPETQLALLVP
jgi:predicted DNA-binding protein with PD1-like motif